ncbi:MAG: hypothetical protein ACOCXA_02695 [Planctomycetota bacterium]
MNGARLILVIAVAFLAFAMMRLAFADRSVVELPPPRWAGEAVRELRVSLPPIEPFAYYYGDSDVNPFVPFAEREVERRRLARPRSERSQRIELPPSQPQQQAEVPLTVPPFEPPAIGELDRISMPQVLGTIAMGERQVLLVLHGGGILQVRPGDAVGEWRLHGIDAQEAIFEDAAGERYRFPLAAMDIRNELAGETGAAGATDAGPEQETTKGRKRSTQELLQAVILNRNNPERLKELLADPEDRRRLMAEPAVQAMLQDPETAAMIEQLLR